MRLARWSFLVLLFMLTTVAPVNGVDPSSGSPREREGGSWIQLFDGETLFGWNAVGESKWDLFEGMLYPEKGNKSKLVTTTAFANYDLEIEYRSQGSSRGSGSGSYDPKTAILIGCDKDGNKITGTRVKGLNGFGSGWTTMHIGVRDGRVTNTSYEDESGRGSGYSEGSGSPFYSGEPPPARAGHIAIQGEHLVIRTIKLRPAKGKEIFNGKDLTGWKEISGKKSKFSVNDEGFLSIKDGPGDIQTEDQWSDFVLQLDCRCNGDNNNSGVFFRSLPGQFWQGYESQIFNKNDEAKPQEYTLEDFDPKTHESTGKRKVKYAALDYGTGGIYNRQPARKQAAKDHEWFTMTVVAQGRHIGVWVNGYMVTDWTDNRPDKESARDGCRLAKGCISLQGHDPTTDLNFRNIRISELPAVPEK
jgi:hypothetical protein